MGKRARWDKLDNLAVLVGHPAAPGLVWFHHPHHLASVVEPELSARCVAARIDAVEHHNQRLVYSGILNRIAAALDQEDNEYAGKEVLSWDAFVRGLRGLWSVRVEQARVKSRERAEAEASKVVEKGEEVGVAGKEEEDEGQIVIIVMNAERLRSVLNAEWAAFTRLSELSGLPATVVLCSQVPWNDIRPMRGDVPEPIHLYMAPPKTEDIEAQLAGASEHPLYSRFLELLLASVGPLAPSSPPLDIDYIANALWPIYTATLPPHEEQTLLGRKYEDPEDPPPPLDVSIQLITDLKSQLAHALSAATESLLSRTAGKEEFVRGLMPVNEEGEPRPMAIRHVPLPPPVDLPLAAKYLLVAAYCASYNPVKSDIRLFGRGAGPDGKRSRGGNRRPGYGKVRIGKIPQRLLGPRSFPIDRLLAMFASLYAEHAPRPEDEATDEQSPQPEIYLPPGEAAARAKRRRELEIEREERWEDEVDQLAFSTKLWSLIPELESRKLLYRVSPIDRLDNIMLRCEIEYEMARNLAKELKIVLDEYLYELTT